MAADDSAPADHVFDTDTRASPTGVAGRFDATLSPRWKALQGVINGGYSVAVCLDALRQLLPHPDPLVVSTFFLRRGVPGPVEVHTDVARKGHHVSTGEARIVQNGEEIVRTTASFADLGSSPNVDAVVLSQMPHLPSPGESIDPFAGGPIPGVTMTEQVELRFPAMPGWQTGQPTGDPSAEFWIRFTNGREPDTLSLPLLVDGAAPVVLELGVAGSATLELTTHIRGRPAPGWLACRVHTRHLIGGYHEEDFELWDTHGNLVAQARQLAVVLDQATKATGS